MLSHWLQKTIYRLVSRQCPLCHLPIATHQNSAWCETCLTYFAPQPRCQQCGLPTLLNVPQCGQCLASPPLWHRLYCVGDYIFPLNHTVHKLKYEGQFWQARNLSALLAPRIDEPAPLITSVPLHWERRLTRGFNQSELLANQLSRQLINATCDHQLIKRKRATPQQKGLSKAQRKQNLQHAFALQRKPNQKHIAIVDDVVTTGSTIQQICKLLLEVGVERIDIYCICRTPEPKD